MDNNDRYPGLAKFLNITKYTGHRCRFIFHSITHSDKRIYENYTYIVFLTDVENLSDGISINNKTSLKKQAYRKLFRYLKLPKAPLNDAITILFINHKDALLLTPHLAKKRTAGRDTLRNFHTKHCLECRWSTRKNCDAPSRNKSLDYPRAFWMLNSIQLTNTHRNKSIISISTLLIIFNAHKQIIKFITKPLLINFLRNSSLPIRPTLTVHQPPMKGCYVIKP